MAPEIVGSLRVNTDLFSATELQRAIRKMRKGETIKENNVPVEAFDAFRVEDGPYFDWVLDFCNKFWQQQCLPEDRETSAVALLYKKGDPSDCNNYRPICLLSAAYKLQASMHKNRLTPALPTTFDVLGLVSGSTAAQKTQST